MNRNGLTRRTFVRTMGDVMLLSTGLGAQAAYGQTASRPTKVSVRLEWFVYGAHAPWFVGLEKGIFAKHGLDLTVNPGRGSGLTAQVVAAGQETFGVVDSSIVPQVLSKGADLRMFYSYVQKGAFGVMFFKNSGIRTARDLEGKRYADIAGTTTNALFPVFCKAAGADVSKIKVITVDGASKVRTFLDRQFEATPCSLIDDFITLRQQGHDIAAIAYSDVGLNILGPGFVAKNSTLQNSPNLARSLVRGFVEAVAITRQDPAAAAQIVKKRVPDSPDPRIQTAMITEVMKRLSTDNSAGKPMGFMAEADWRSTVDILTRGGLVQANTNLATLYTNEFLAT